jgi:hypothetical protein
MGPSRVRCQVWVCRLVTGSKLLLLLLVFPRSRIFQNKVGWKRGNFMPKDLFSCTAVHRVLAIRNLRRTWFNSMAVHVAFDVDVVTVWQVFFQKNTSPTNYCYTSNPYSSVTSKEVWDLSHLMWQSLFSVEVSSPARQMARLGVEKVTLAKMNRRSHSVNAWIVIDYISWMNPYSSRLASF